MNEVTLEFEVNAVCETAEGLKSGALLNGKATGLITVQGDLQQLQSGNGDVTVGGKLLTLTKPNGSDGLPELKGKGSFEGVKCRLVNHELSFKQDVADKAVTLTIGAKVLARGTVIIGTVFADVNKWLWRLALRRAFVAFQGALKPE